MAIKLRSLATSAITKTILWVLILTFSFFALRGLVTVYRTADQSDLPMESLGEMKYVDSYDFMQSRRDIVAALYWGYDISKLYNIDKLPTLYYRAEHGDGSVVTNAEGKDAEFFRSHTLHGAYKTLPDGNWQELSLNGSRRNLYPNNISYDTVQVFSDHRHVYSKSYARGAAPNQKDTFGLTVPEDLPSLVAWRIYGSSTANRQYDNDSYSYSYTNGFGITRNYSASSSYSDANEIVENTQPYREPPRGSSDTIPMEGGNYVDIAQFSDEQIEAEYQQWLLEHPIPSATIYYAFDEASLAAYEDFWAQSRDYYYTQFGSLLGLALVPLLAALWLLVVCGRRPADTELHLLPTERIWSEVILAAGFFAVFGTCFFFYVGVEAMVYNQLYMDERLINLFCIGIPLLAAVVLFIAMSLVRLLKAKRLIRNSLTFKVCYWVWVPVTRAFDALRSCFDERSFQKTSPLTKALQKRQIAYFGTLGAVLMIILFFILMDGGEAAFFLSLFLVAVIAGISYWHIKGNLKTYSEINKGFNESLDEQMKSERTKTALITNVSHDLKTPLTSIITYVELLSKEELSDSARDYVTVIEQKSERLKSMVADLFDLSKSTSGNIPLDMETLDLKRLIEQTLADMRDHIDASELVMKVKLPEHEVNIYSDGKKLYRVFQNIIDNALKYSLAGTRVFITLEVENGRAVASVKNTSAYEMDFTAEDVLQRFSRGDKSRTGDGSGLGLSIAESFTVACGGDFKVELDGDLFKVTIIFDVK